jgi:hypothetical protein
MKDVAPSVPFYNFFEYLDLDSAAIPLADFSIQCTESGTRKMNAANLAVRFPAIVSSDSSFRKFYFAGDFADCDVPSLFTYAAEIEYPLKVLMHFYFVSDQTRFFWQVYLPVMDAIFERSVERSHSSSVPAGTNSTR